MNNDEHKRAHYDAMLKATQAQNVLLERIANALERIAEQTDSDVRYGVELDVDSGDEGPFYHPFDSFMGKDECLICRNPLRHLSHEKHEPRNAPQPPKSPTFSPHAPHPFIGMRVPHSDGTLHTSCRTCGLAQSEGDVHT